MNENILKNLDILSLYKEYNVLKHTAGNFRCRHCRMVDGYGNEETRCRWCGGEIFELDKL